jgi:hypothetical protein
MKFRPLAAWGIFWGSAVVLSTAALVNAFNPQPDPPGHYYGLMSMPTDQQVSIHVANVKMAVDSFRPAAGNCTAQMSIVDACGNVLARRSVRIAPTRSATLDFMLPPDPDLPPDPCSDPSTEITGDPPGDVTSDPPGEFDPPAPIRVRAQVVFTGNASHCVSSVEVGDPFGDPPGGRSGGGFIHPGLIVGFNPQPDPPGAPTKTPR